jgi:hypothetical protein
MKWILFLFSVTAYGQAAVSCYDVRILEKTMCTYADGTGTMYDASDFSSSLTEYKDPAAWTRMMSLVDAEAKKKLEKREAMLRAAQAETAAAMEKEHRFSRAATITKKKTCIAEGFTWVKGSCSLSPGL